MAIVLSVNGHHYRNAVRQEAEEHGVDRATIIRDLQWLERHGYLVRRTSKAGHDRLYRTQDGARWVLEFRLPVFGMRVPQMFRTLAWKSS
jgi:DNA-binding transcriptional MocR family regulator